MARRRLISRQFLDPRPAADSTSRPYFDAVNIPLAEIPNRTHELPPRVVPIPVVGEPELVAATIAQLEALGRAAFAAEPAPWVQAGEHETGRLWRPNRLLEVALAQLPEGRAVDLGCGTGRDAVYLASCGWRVTAIDRLPDALERGRELARRYDLGGGEIDWRQMDLTCADRFAEAADLVCLFRLFDREILRRAVEALRPGGSLLCEAFTTLHQQKHGRPAEAARVAGEGELAALLSDCTLRDYEENWSGGAHTARAWAVRT